MLLKLEKRPMPNVFSAQRLTPMNKPRTCCFDTARWPSTWKASTVCERCTFLNQLLHGEYALHSRSSAQM